MAPISAKGGGIRSASAVSHNFEDERCKFRTHAAQQILVYALQQYAHATRRLWWAHRVMATIEIPIDGVCGRGGASPEQRETPKLNDGGATEIVLLRTRHPQFLARRCGQPDCRSIQGSSPGRPFRLQ